jgi:hypothetical protein
VGRLARVDRIQLAADLVARADVRDVAGADRGPWPRWWRITLGALVLVVGLVAWRLVVRSGHIRRPLRFDRAVGHGDTGDSS